MNTNIVVITSHFLRPHIEEIYSNLDLECNIKVVAYDNFNTIHKIYDQYAACTNGFLVSGTAAKAAIEVVEHELKRPIISFEIDSAGLYRSILDLLLENRDLNMNRLIIDFMIPLEGGITANDFFKWMDLNYDKSHIDIWSETLNRENFAKLEGQIINEILRLWNMDAIDMVLCQYSNLIPILEEHNIPYRYPIPTPLFLKDLTKRFMYILSLEYMRENLPVVISIFASDNSLNTEENIQLIAHHTNKFFQSNAINCVIQEEKSHCSTIITVENLHKITNNEKNCNLSVYLNKYIDFEISIGYGIGINLEMAVNNAYTAQRESLLSGKSFVFTENGNLIGPLSSKECMVIENQAIYDIGKIAKNSSLSAITIKKIIAIIKINNSNMITTQDLSLHLKSTVRNANRILKNLEKSGYAKITSTQTTNTKGRPTKVYELNFHI